MLASDLRGLPWITREFRGNQFRIPAHPIVEKVFSEEAHILDACWHIKPADVVVDVGSHFGCYTIPSLACGAEVYAVDPDTEVSAVLAAIYAGNPDLPGHLAMASEALVDRGGLTPEFRAGLETMPHPSMATPLDCAYSCLDELAQERGLTRVDWVKIDTEGLELAVLRGGEGVLRDMSPALLIEDHEDIYPFVREMNSKAQYTQFLEGLGYGLRTIYGKWIVAVKES